jgi:hypothetical protein
VRSGEVCDNASREEQAKRLSAEGQARELYEQTQRQEAMMEGLKRLADQLKADAARTAQERDSLAQAADATGDRANRVADGLRVVRDHLQSENASMREELNLMKNRASQHRLELAKLQEEVTRSDSRRQVNTPETVLAPTAEAETHRNCPIGRWVHTVCILVVRLHVGPVGPVRYMCAVRCWHLLAVCVCVGVCACLAPVLESCVLRRLHSRRQVRNSLWIPLLACQLGTSFRERVHRRDAIGC